MGARRRAGGVDALRQSRAGRSAAAASPILGRGGFVAIDARGMPPRSAPLPAVAAQPARQAHRSPDRSLDGNPERRSRSTGPDRHEDHRHEAHQRRLGHWCDQDGSAREICDGHHLLSDRAATRVAAVPSQGEPKPVIRRMYKRQWRADCVMVLTSADSPRPAIIGHTVRR
jgi:hypothetical protein